MGGFPYPASLFMFPAEHAHAITVARPMSLDNLPEFVPIDGAKIPVSCFFIVAQFRIRQCQFHRFCLRY